MPMGGDFREHPPIPFIFGHGAIILIIFLKHQI